MINPKTVLRIMELQREFSGRHPKVTAFLNAVFSRGIQEGTVLELTVTKPGEAPVTTNMRVSAEDIALFEELKELKK